MNNVSINCFMASLSVNSSYGYNLEFILDNAEERANKYYKAFSVYPKYIECLCNMLHEELDKVEARLTDTCVYGDVSFTIEADTLEQLQKAIIRADKVTKKWINKYNINKMKGQ